MSSANLSGIAAKQKCQTQSPCQMQFLKRLREPIRNKEITISVRIWQSPRVKVGGTCRLDPGHIRITDVREIALRDITPQMAIDSGFSGVVDLLKTARHGAGRRIYLVTFEYFP